MATVYIAGEARTLAVGDIVTESERVGDDDALPVRSFRVESYRAIARPERDEGGDVTAFVLGWLYTVSGVP